MRQDEPSRSISKQLFAAELGVTPGRVSQLIKLGLPVEPDNKIDLAKGKAWIEENVAPNKRRMRINSDERLRSASRRDREESEARISRMKADRLADSLIDRDATLRAIETRARIERDGWISWVNRAAPEVARVCEVDISSVTIVLDRMVRDQLASFAAMPVQFGGPPPDVMSEDGEVET